jgi:hypothetical protein
MALSRRRFFAGLVGAVGAVVGLKAVRAAPLEDWTVETEVGPSFRSLAQEKADLAAMALDQRLMALQERAYRDYAYLTPPPWQPMLPPPPEIRDIVKLRDYANEQIRDFYMTRPPAPIFIPREALEHETYAEYQVRRKREGRLLDDPHAWQPGPGPDWLNP